MLRGLAATVVVLLCTVSAWGELTAEQSKQAQVLIAQFTSPEFAARQKAVEELLKMGPAVLPLVRKTLAETKDDEVKLRCQMVIDGVKRDSEARAGTPKQDDEVRGVVLDRDGKAVGGASVLVLPSSDEGVVRTDAKGGFHFDRRQMLPRGRTEPPHILVRHVERNLAAMIPMKEGKTDYDIQLAPGLTVTGKVTDTDGKPLDEVHVRAGICYAGARIFLNTGCYGITDLKGYYEIKACPGGRNYIVFALPAEGYGQNFSKLLAGPVGEDTLAVEDMTLAKANLTISGVVVDDGDVPVEGAYVQVGGPRQVVHAVKTDAQGKFVLDRICAGDLELLVVVVETRLQGRYKGRGGDKDVKIVVKKQGQ